MRPRIGAADNSCKDSARDVLGDGFLLHEAARTLRPHSVVIADMPRANRWTELLEVLIS